MDYISKSKISSDDISQVAQAAHAQAAAVDSRSRSSLDRSSFGVREYLHQIESLKTVSENWRKTLSEYGGVADACVFDIDTHFDGKFEEKARIQTKTEKLKRHSVVQKIGGTGFVKWIPVPDRRSRVEEVEASLNHARDGVQNAREILHRNIYNILKDERVCIKSLQMRFEKDLSMNFKQDAKYVRLEAENVVVNALKTHGPRLVLLYGGPGEGKSALARSLALQASPRDDAAADPQLFNSRFSGGSSDKGGASIFELALFLKCGQGLDISDHYSKLRNCLRLDSLYGKEIMKRLKLPKGLDDVPVHESLIALAASATNFNPKIWRSKTEEDVLRRLLKDEQILVILDGMSDPIHHPIILQQMINLCHNYGRNVVNLKFLVTSRSADLCKGLNFTNFAFTSVAMKEYNRDSRHAREILASHVEWPELDTYDKFRMNNGMAVPKEDDYVDCIIESTDANPFALACVAKFYSTSPPARAALKMVPVSLTKLLHLQDTATLHDESYIPGIWISIQNEFKALQEKEKDFLILIHLCTSKRTPILTDVVVSLWENMFSSTSTTFLKTMWFKLDSKAFIKRGSLEIPDSWLVRSLTRAFIDDQKQDEQRRMLARIVNILLDIEVKDGYFQQQLQNIRLLLPYNFADNALMMKITKSREALEVFVRGLSQQIKTVTHDLREHAARAVSLLTNGSENVHVKIHIARSLGILQGLANAMTKDNSSDLQNHARTALANLTADGLPSVIYSTIVDTCRGKRVNVNPDFSKENANLQECAEEVFDTLVDGKHQDSYIKREIAKRRASSDHLVKDDHLDGTTKALEEFGSQFKSQSR